MPPTNNTRPNSFEDHPDGATNKEGLPTNPEDHLPTNSGDHIPTNPEDHPPTNSSGDHPPTNCMPTNTPDEGKSWGGEDEEGRRRSKRHRVRVFTNPVGQTSPTLYARANRHLCQEGSLKAYPRTVDFVLVNQLPAVGSFSYRDDSVESKSPNRLERKMTAPSCLGEPLGVDLLNGLLPSHKESALKVVADNHRACVASDFEVANDLDSCDLEVARCGPDCVPGGEGYVPPDFQNNFHCVSYVEASNGSDYVDRSSHYAYNSYKFSQIGRPPELSPSDTQ